MTRLLILTQAVDQNNPVLGFFPSWVAKFGGYCERVTVICLERGEYSLPANVKILSLGKEEKRGRLRYMLRLCRYLWREHDNYDTVFVHMNQEYVLLAAWWWRLTGKRIWFWRNHRYGSWLTRLAVWFSHRVYYTSPQSFTARFRKARQMPVGIDTTIFCLQPDVVRVPRSVLALGRISRVKRLDVLLRALLVLQEQGIKFRSDIIGSPITPEDRKYEEELKQLAQPLVSAGLTQFHRAVPHLTTPRSYNSHEIYVNLTSAGAMDKTIFEALACGAIPVLKPEQEVVITGLALEIQKILDLSMAQKELIRRDLTEEVRSRQSLDILAERLFANQIDQ